MPIHANDDNALHDLAQAMAAGGHHSTATALRKLAYEGYSTLEEVDTVPDWILLSIRGIGLSRLAGVRRLSRPDWRPPSRQAIQAGVWFVSAARFALRYWPPETLTAFIQSSTLPKAKRRSVEKRLALDVFSQATHQAQRYCTAEELVQALWQARNGHAPKVLAIQQSPPGYDVQMSSFDDSLTEASTLDPLTVSLDEGVAVREPDHFAYPARERREIVQRYRLARERGEVTNKESWAQANYNITAKTLLAYEREFPKPGE